MTDTVGGAFPSSPSNNDTHTPDSGVKYQYVSATKKWMIVTGSALYATAAQGTKADTAVQGNGVSVETTWTDSDTKVCSSKAMQTKVAAQLHAAVTVSSPISISTQAISIVNDAAATITEVDTGVLNVNSDTVIPTSKATGSYVGSVMLRHSDSKFALSKYPTFTKQLGNYANANYTDHNGIANNATTLTMTGAEWDLAMFMGSTVVLSGVYTFGCWIKLGTATNFAMAPNDTIGWNTVTGKTWTAADGLSNSAWIYITNAFTMSASRTTCNWHIGYTGNAGQTQQTAGTLFVSEMEIWRSG